MTDLETGRFLGTRVFEYQQRLEARVKELEQVNADLLAALEEYVEWSEDHPEAGAE